MLSMVKWLAITNCWSSKRQALISNIFTSAASLKSQILKSWKKVSPRAIAVYAIFLILKFFRKRVAMYSFEPTAEQQMLIDAVGKYASNDLRAAAREAEESHALPMKLVSKGWELGLLQASVPESYGGFGERNAVTGVLALEEMAFGDLAGTLAVLTPSLFATPIFLAGSEEQKQAYLPKIISSNWSPYTAALIEYAFDFDPNALKTNATLSGDEYILNGEKAFVPFAKDAKCILVYADPHP